jgi:8-hydroxy-5-deazaflavin:NADPH oxidoreductase
MKVGFIGAGTVTGTIGRHLITAGHTIVVSNSRGPETLTDFVANLDGMDTGLFDKQASYRHLHIRRRHRSQTACDGVD